MKVLYIADTYEIGGAFLSFIDLLECIVENHKDIVPIVLSSKNGKNNIFASEHGIENYSIGHRAFTMNDGSTVPRRIVRIVTRPFLKIRYELSNRKALEKAEKLIDFSDIDIIHSNSNRNDIGALLAKKHNIPHVWHLREYGEDCFALKRDYIDFMNSHADCFVAVSQAVKDEWIKKGLQTNKIRVVYDGVDDVAIENEQFYRKEITKGVITGFISPFKGQYDLLKSLELIKKDLRNRFKLDIYGHVAFEYLLKLKLYVITHGLKGIVEFKGYVNDVGKNYSDYDLGFMCSKVEGFGRATVEYMMSGLCVIASDTGANREIIENGVNGYIYRYKDNYDLAKKIKHAIDTPNETRICARKGANDAARLYTKELNADKIHNLYYEMKKI